MEQPSVEAMGIAEKLIQNAQLSCIPIGYLDGTQREQLMETWTSYNRMQVEDIRRKQDYEKRKREEEDLFIERLRNEQCASLTVLVGGLGMIFLAMCGKAHIAKLLTRLGFHGG